MTAEVKKKRIAVELLRLCGADFQKLILTIKQYIVCKIRKPLFEENDVMVTIFNPQNVVWIFFQTITQNEKVKTNIFLNLIYVKGQPKKFRLKKIWVIQFIMNGHQMSRTLHEANGLVAFVMTRLRFCPTKNQSNC